MTTGRINQIPYLAGAPGRRRGRTRGHPGPPEGDQSSVYQSGCDHPGGSGGPAYRGLLTPIQLPPLSPSARVRTQAGPPAPEGAGGRLRHTAFGRRTGPRRSRSRRAATTGRLPPRVFRRAWPEARRPQTPSAPETIVPGLQPPPAAQGTPGGGWSPPHLRTPRHREGTGQVWKMGE